jgi:integrase
MLVATTGVRLEALTGLVLQEVDFDGRRISPASARRSCVLDPTAYDALKEHVATWEVERFLLRQKAQKLFVWSNGEQVDPGAVRTMFRQHCSLAGVPVVSMHAMRQAYVVAALESGIPVKQISDRLSDSAELQTLGTSQGTDKRAIGRPRRNAKAREGGRSCHWRSF